MKKYIKSELKRFNKFLEYKIKHAQEDRRNVSDIFREYLGVAIENAYNKGYGNITKK